MDKLKFMQWANKLSETELRNMAVSALRNAPSDLQFDNVGREAEGIKLSGDKQRLAPNGKPSNLNAMQHAQVRTPEFKKWFGDWEALAKQNEIDAFIDKALLDKDPRGSIVLRDVTESERNEVLRQGGPDIIGMQHILDAQEIHHAEKRHGGAGEKSQQPDQRPLTTDDLKRIAVVLDGYDAIKVQTRVHNKTSLIYSKQFSDGKIEYVERVLETSEKHKPRLITKTVWVKVTTGVKPSPTQVYTPDHKSNLPFKNGRVNPDTVSKVVDENGEPLVVYLGTDKSFAVKLTIKEGSNGFKLYDHNALEMAKPDSIDAGLSSATPLKNAEKLDYRSISGLPVSLEQMLEAFNGRYDKCLPLEITASNSTDYFIASSPSDSDSIMNIFIKV